MLIALQVVGILSMLTFMFVGIWGFIILNKIYAQMKYKNYLLEKLNLNINGIKKHGILDQALNAVEQNGYNENLNTAEQSDDENEEK